MYNNIYTPNAISDTSFDGRLLSSVVLKYSPPLVLLPTDVVDVFLPRRLTSLCAAIQEQSDTCVLIHAHAHMYVYIYIYIYIYIYNTYTGVNFYNTALRERTIIDI